MAIWKVSYVVKASDQAGGIVNLNHPPQVGEELQVGETRLKILESVELIPPRGDFHYFHVTCRIVA
ncbi:MAG TPA: hypothetical protein DEH22_05215 [Chloroflexi bacterium]|nr:hypothetical protein [Chloroflexota bacterium]